MITEDCDPVMAKLKHSEELSKCEVGTDVAYIGRQASIGSYNSKGVNQSIPMPNRTSSPSIIKKVMRAFN
jgi:radical SAM superfamily enzyme with C-terminal helix-hairpin-helix motif